MAETRQAGQVRHLCVRYQAWPAFGLETGASLQRADFDCRLPESQG